MEVTNVDGAVGVNEIRWVGCVNCKEKRVEVEALEMIEKERELQEPLSSQLPAALCQALWSLPCTCVS